MNNQQVTLAVVLARTDYGEADRIITFLTPAHGKLRLMAKGVRRIKSKLAGGVELFSVTNITFIRGRGDIGTLISSRLVTHYGHIAADLDRTMAGYELIAQLHKATEDEPEGDYYHLLEEVFRALDDPAVPLPLIRLWFAAQLLSLGGHTPNLTHDVGGQRLMPEQAYEFSFDDQAFIARPGGAFTASEIKFLRLVFGGSRPAALAKISGAAQLTDRVASLVNFMRTAYIR